MKKKTYETPQSYFDKINDISLTAIFHILGIKVENTRGGKSDFSIHAYYVKCPFHREKTASLAFSRTRRCFSCRGCGQSGTVFDFVKYTLKEQTRGDYDNVGVYKWFKKHFGIPLPWEKRNGKFIYK